MALKPSPHHIIGRQQTFFLGLTRSIRWKDQRKRAQNVGEIGAAETVQMGDDGVQIAPQTKVCG
ncbi:MAG: hypothetical protein L0154_16595 [Chloroflexi bacterium]|nr:hypothetical protein [Chloroflexota bacterium]